MVQDAPFRAFACNRRAVALEFVRDSREAGQAKEDVMAKGQMRSNKEKKKPKQDKNKKDKGVAPSPFTAGQAQPGQNPFGKKSP
jgi:hypothetical protein